MGEYIMKCEELENLEKVFPLCREHNPELFEEVSQSILIMTEVSGRLKIPLCELIEFFYKGKLKIELIKEQEEALKNYEQRRDSLL